MEKIKGYKSPLDYARGRQVASLIFILLLGVWSPLFAQPVKSAQAGNKISLDIKGMDVIDVLKTLSSRSGLNLVIGKNVTGRVTLFLKDVDVWDAFEIVLLANDLAYEKKGNIINVMTQRDYELVYGERYQDKKQAKIIQLKFAKAADLARALSQIKSNIGRVVVDETSNTIALIDAPNKIVEMEEFIKRTDLPLETRVFSLNYAPADKLLPKIQEAVTKNLGSIRMDERTNKIAITDYPAKLDEINKIITAFDEKTAQVLIDAQVIEVTPSDQFQMGVDWEYWINKYFDIKLNLPINTITSGNSLFMGTLKQTSVDEPGKYKGVIDILRTIGDTKILSSPRIMAINNQEAKILVGTKEAYITQTVSQGSSGIEVTADQVNFVDVGIKLYVTPTINRDNFVTMKIRPEISSSDYKDFGTTAKPNLVPIVTTSESETAVMVKDGVTIIIGGMRKDKRTKNVKQVPLIGDIPGLGNLFRRTDDKVETSDLVILLTPHIMTGERSYTDFSEIPPKEGVVASMVKGKIVTKKFPSEVKSADTNIPVQGAAAYYQRLLNKINSFAKSNQPSGKKGEVVLTFTVKSNGSLLGEPQASSSNPGLTEYAINAVKGASPFDSFPYDLVKSEETFKVSLMYE
ncbi:MAG: hypothetical protein KJ880_02270 [Candidatus Omnitrophica bacterium]|nr:hypothetical protein [Candidatus Omnitrophota bacterium]MBU1870255.1 hypothetical protein [Candidatus Omnitrophota bacterium]